MRIDPRMVPLPSAAPRRNAGPGTFSVAERGASARAGAPAAAASASTLDAMLALQGDPGDAAERRRRGARRGHDLLDALDRLKAALLGGRVPLADLQAIAARLAERSGPSGDPGLDEVLAHVELRARVEIAKVEMAKLARRA